jgi:hypothetical protein
MPSELEDPRARQLEALRRYMAQLGTDGDQAATGPAAPATEHRRPPLRWVLLTAVAVAVALAGGVLVGAVAWSDDRPAGGDAGTASSADRGGATSVATPVATPACKTAVDRANAMLASAVKLREDFAAQVQTLRDPANRDLSADQLLKRLAPLHQAGSDEASRFDRELDAYRQIVDKCDVRAP